MKLINFNMPLRKKLMIFFIAFTVLPILLMGGLFYYQFNLISEKTTEEKLNHSIEVVDYFINKKSDEALAIANRYANRKDLVDAFIRKDREELDKLIVPIFKDLKEEIQLSVFEFGDENGTVFTRGHSPGKYGDNKINNTSINATLKDKEIKGLEFGKSGLHIRAFVPIKNNGKVIGTFQVGFNDIIFNDISASIDANFSLYSKDVLVKTTDQQQTTNLNTPLGDATIYDRVSKGETVRINDENNQIKIFYPMYDTLHETVQGMFSVTLNLTHINSFKKSVLTNSIVYIAVFLLLALVISIVLSWNIAKPLKNTVEIIKNVSEGNLKVPVINSNHNQIEIGQLLNSVDLMVFSLKSLIFEIKETTNVLSQHSSSLSISSNEVTAIADRVSTSINELAKGSEYQADFVKNENTEISKFLDGLDSITHGIYNSQNICHKAKKIVEVGMNTVHDEDKKNEENKKIISNAIEVVSSLSKKSEIIGEIVEAIKSISEQTNLLSLNAAIEAARAGENGKGFSVVADEVRKLAVESNQSSVKIFELIKNIREDIESVNLEMDKVSTVVNQQEKYLSDITDKFKDMAIIVSELTNDFQRINQKANHLRDDVSNTKAIMNSIQDIALKSSCDSQEISASSTELHSVITNVFQSASELSSLTTRLKNNIDKFKI